MEAACVHTIKALCNISQADFLWGGIVNPLPIPHIGGLSSLFQCTVKPEFYIPTCCVFHNFMHFCTVPDKCAFVL
jgi:hypothetical protein